MSALGMWMGEARSAVAAPAVRFRVAPFSVDVTIPLGHPCMAGGISPATEILEPLFANGLVLTGADQPLVFLSVDWCEIRNDAYDRWREAVAAAVGTVPGRVLLSCTHVHDAPVADLEAERRPEAAGAKGRICDLAFHEKTVNQVALAAKLAMSKLQSVTHLGVGQAKVQNVASNRRYLLPDGRVAFDRTSATKNVLARSADGGLIDPSLKTISFWDGFRPIAALSAYATHPMSYYGKGGVSSDFIGLARWRRCQDDRSVAQIYFSGCSGNVTAGKYNDGDPVNRGLLADRVYQAMAQAWKTTRRYKLERVEFRSVPVELEPRNDAGFSVEESEATIRGAGTPFQQNLAAMNLSWRKRVAERRPVEVPVVDFGSAQFLLLPAESYVEFQLHAQAQRPRSMVMVAGYGECAPGYIPTDTAWKEKDSNLRDWCWVAPGAEQVLKKAVTEVLRPSPRR